MRTKKQPELVPDQPSLSQEDLVRAATNSPSLAKNTVILGDRTFPIVDLPYDAFIRFLALLQPLLEVFASKITGGLTSSTGGFTASSIVTYLADSLPELALICVEQTDPTMTVQKVKEMGRTPFALANIVIKQIEANKIIGEISDFFVTLLPLLTMNAAKK